MNELDGLTALIIEPHAGMRATLHNMRSDSASLAYSRLYVEFGAKEGCQLAAEHNTLTDPWAVGSTMLSARIWPQLMP